MANRVVAAFSGGKIVPLPSGDSLIDAGGAAVGSGGSLPYEIVAATDAPQAWKDAATRQCDGTSDNVEIQAAIDALDTSGGIVMLSPGNFAIAAALDFTGNDNTDTETTVQLIGAGIRATNLNGASNIDVISITGCSKVVIRDMCITILGTGDGISSTEGATTHRAFWLSQFENLLIQEGNTSATGWAMNLGSPFRSTFKNIDTYCHQGIYLASEDAAFNPGDCTFDRCFIELTGTSTVGLHISSPTGNGSMNQIRFNMFEIYGNGGTCKGILLDGSAGVNHCDFRGVNCENVNMVLDVDYGQGNTFEFNYINAVGTTPIYFRTQADAFDNHVRKASFIYCDSTSSIITDQSTNAGAPNRFENLYIGVETSVTASVTAQPHTVIRSTGGYNSGTLATELVVRQQRVGSTTSSATPTINTDLYSHYEITAQTVDITSFTTNLSGTPQRGQKLWIAVTGTGARAITWGASFESGAVALPTTTTSTQRLDVGFVWNPSSSKWRCMASGSA